MSTAHEERIKQELITAGVTKYGLKKFTIRHLPKIIHEDEHIGGVVYGRYTINEKSSGWSQGVLVATDRRVIFLDHKPGYTSMDEITYEVVAGIKYSTSAYAVVTLQTRLGDYTIRFGNRKCADTFIEYVEERQLVKSSGQRKKNIENNLLSQSSSESKKFTKEERKFLQAHEVAVISTLDRTGNIHGAVVYYFIPPKQDCLYILTKDETQKARDMFYRNQVAVTVFDENQLQTIQIQAITNIENDVNKRGEIFNEIVKLRSYTSGKSLPPVSQLKDGAFVAVRISPTSIKYTDFQHKD